MIVTVTLNTSIDKAYQLAAPVEVGTVMRVERCIDNAGGKGLNAARAVAACGEKIVATGFVGGNNGRLLCELLDADGIAHDFVQVAAETRCCVNALEPGGRSTEFLEPGRKVEEADVEAVVRKVSELAAAADAVTIDGSVPAGCPADIYRTLVAAVHDAGKPVILDTSGALLVNSIDARPDVIKPNADEIQAILGRRPDSLDEVVAAAREVVEKHGVGRVVVSLGGDGSVMATADGVWRGRAPKIEVVNPVGSGDTMVGAMAVAMARGMGIEEQLAYAMSCASANCLSAATGRFEASAAAELLAQTSVEKIA